MTHVEATVRGPTGAEARVQLLVDSGAMYSLLPVAVWQAIGLAPKREEEFVLADGTRVRRAVTECHISLNEREGHTPVILGRPGDDLALLGVVTLENLGLVLDPFSRRLYPMLGLMV